MNIHKSESMSTIKRSVAAICAGLFLVAGVALAQSTMTDTQVLDYVQQAMASGKGRDEMVAELKAVPRPRAWSRTRAASIP